MIIKNAYMSKFQRKGIFIPCFQGETGISVYWIIFTNMNCLKRIYIIIHL